MPDDVRERLEAQAEEQHDDASDQFVGVAEVNWQAVQVYVRCKWVRAMAPTGQVVFLCISTDEVKAIAGALDVPFNDDLLDRIIVMEQTAVGLLNKRDS